MPHIVPRFCIRRKKYPRVQNHIFSENPCFLPFALPNSSGTYMLSRNYRLKDFFCMSCPSRSTTVCLCSEMYVYSVQMPSTLLTLSHKNCFKCIKNHGFFTHKVDGQPQNFPFKLLVPGCLLFDFAPQYMSSFLGEGYSAIDIEFSVN